MSKLCRHNSLACTIDNIFWAAPASVEECELQYALGTIERGFWDIQLYTDYYTPGQYHWCHYTLTIYAHIKFNYFDYTKSKFIDWLKNDFNAIEIRSYNIHYDEILRESFVIIPAPDDFKVLGRYNCS